MTYGAPTQLPFGDEGRAMLQIVHDVAPGASLAFYTAENGEADFATGIGALRRHRQPRSLLTMSVTSMSRSSRTVMVAQAIDAVVARAWPISPPRAMTGPTPTTITAPSFATLSNTAPTTGEYLLNFDNSGATTRTSLSINVPALDQGDLIALVLQWDQPYVTGAAGSPGATSHLDLCVTGAGGDTIINESGTAVTCTGPNATGADPVQILIVSNPANAPARTAPQTINVSIGLADGTAPPGRVKLAVEGGGLQISVTPSTYAHNPTLQGHPGAAGAAAVGAAPFYKTPECGVSPAVLEPFSARGGAPDPVR